METLVKTRSLGGSLVVTIPKNIVDTEDIRSNETVKIIVTKIKKDGFGMFKGIGSFTEEDELDTHE